MELDSRILVLVVVPDGDAHEATPLQGFSPSLCQNPWIVEAATFIPSSIFDLTPAGQKTLIARRMSGADPINWFGQSPSTLKSQRTSERSPFVFVLIPPGVETVEYVEWAKASVVPPTIVAGTGGDLTFSQLTIKHLQNRLLQVCDLIPANVDKRVVDVAKKVIGAWAPPDLSHLGYQVGGHNTVKPNVRVLESAGFKNIIRGRFNQIGQGIQPYIDQIVLTTNSVLDVREDIGRRLMPAVFPATMDLNLFAPAIFPFMFKVSPPADIPKEDRKRFVLARRLLERQTGYGFTIQTEAQKKVVLGDWTETSKAGAISPHPLFLIRQEELGLATEVIAALAVSEVSAVIRLPNGVSRTSGAVRSFAAARRAVDPSPQKLLKTFKQVQEYMRQTIPKEFVTIVKRSKTGIRIVADAHLEWMDIDGLPLCIRRDVTRVPVTPGNLFLQVVGAHHPILLSIENFQDILVLNALGRTDQIRRAFEVAFNEFEPAWSDRLRIAFVEVSAKEELVEAINNFEGSVVVFDGHGGHKSDEPAQLFLHETPVNVWELKGLLTKVPPIVILSACDTHAADRNHATTANGFLSLGVRTVLASVFPLDALQAAIFVARLLFRIAVYIPSVTEALGRAIGWNEIVSGMLRMQLLTDFLRQLEKSGAIDEAAYLKVHKLGNEAINGGRKPPSPDPFALVLQMLINDFGLPEEDMKLAFDTAVASSSALSYVQLGRPETISITRPEILQDFEKMFEDLSNPEHGDGLKFA